MPADLLDLALYAGAFLAIGCSCAGLIWIRLKPGTANESLEIKKQELEYAVTFWRYPDGGLVPQHKRMRLMRELHDVCRQLRSAR